MFTTSYSFTWPKALGPWPKGHRPLSNKGRSPFNKGRRPRAQLGLWPRGPTIMASRPAGPQAILYKPAGLIVYAPYKGP